MYPLQWIQRGWLLGFCRRWSICLVVSVKAIFGARQKSWNCIHSLSNRHRFTKRKIKEPFVPGNWWDDEWVRGRWPFTVERAFDIRRSISPLGPFAWCENYARMTSEWVEKVKSTKETLTHLPKGYHCARSIFHFIVVGLSVLVSSTRRKWKQKPSLLWTSFEHSAPDSPTVYISKMNSFKAEDPVYGYSRASMTMWRPGKNISRWRRHDIDRRWILM